MASRLPPAAKYSRIIPVEGVGQILLAGWARTAGWAGVQSRRKLLAGRGGRPTAGGQVGRSGGSAGAERPVAPCERSGGRGWGMRSAGARCRRAGALGV
eukprot:8245703-Heterocapsa_arctica.AAC.1